MLTRNVGGMEEQQLNTYVIIKPSCEPGQAHYAALCFVQLKEPLGGISEYFIHETCMQVSKALYY